MAKTNLQPYFPHEATSRLTQQMTALRMDHGVAGYGVYYMLLERLRLAENYEEEYLERSIAYDLDCDPSLITSVIFDYGLFEIRYEPEATIYSSIELNEKMAHMEEVRARRSAAARRAAECRWAKVNGTGCPMETNPEGGAIPEGCSMPPVDELKPDIPKVRVKEKKEDLLLPDVWAKHMRDNESWLEMTRKRYNFTQETLSLLIDKFVKSWKDRNCQHVHIGEACSHFRLYVEANLKHNWLQKLVRKSQGTPERLSQAETDRLQKSFGYVSERSKRAKKGVDDMVTSKIYRNLGYMPFCVAFSEFTAEYRAANPPTHPEWIGRFPLPEGVEIPM